MMAKPPRRPDIPPRHSDNIKRRLMLNPDKRIIGVLIKRACYGGYAKHKRHPAHFGMVPDRGLHEGDATLCDEHAGFGPQDCKRIPVLLRRGARAGLLGQDCRAGIPRVLWTIDDNGWIYEARLTNHVACEYHGYPIRPSEAIARQVYERFSQWVEDCGVKEDRRAMIQCKVRYGIHSNERIQD